MSTPARKPSAMSPKGKLVVIAIYLGVQQVFVELSSEDLYIPDA
jgi:hypothetical protein